MPAPATPQKPHIPDYELLRRIGRGAYGHVWLARGVAQTYRAVKVVYSEKFESPRPFERELAGIRAFDPISRGHEGLVDVLHVGQSPGLFYYIMELADDVAVGQEINPETYKPKTLKSVLDHKTRLQFPEVLELGMTLTKALTYLHTRGLAHRDIKPSNIIFVNGAPKLADVGSVARMSDPQSFVGTEGFIPPEGPGTPQADIFSLGRVLYEASLGQDRNTFPRVPVVLEEWPDADRLKELVEIIIKACQNDFRRRYQTADELYADLTSLVNGRSIRRLRVLERKWARAKGYAIAAGICLAALGVFAFEYFQSVRRRDEDRARAVGGYVARGIEKTDTGEMIQALPNFVKALAADHRANERLHRTRIASVLEQCPKLLQIWNNGHEATDGQFSPDGSIVAIATRDAQIHIKDCRTGHELAKPFGPNNFVQTLSFYGDGRSVLVCAYDGSAAMWDWQSGTNQLTIPRHSVSVASVQSDHHGDRIITACEDKRARVVDAHTGEQLLMLTNHTAGVRFAAFSPDDQLIVTTGIDNTALLYEASTGKLIHTLRHKSWVLHASFSPDGKRLATACFDREAHVWDIDSATSGSLPREIMPGLRHEDGIGSVEFSPDGNLLLTASWDMTARIWLASSGRPYGPTHTLPHTSRVLRAAFAPDGHRIITSCYDGTSRLWDLAGTMVTPKIVSGRFCETASRTIERSKAGLQVFDPLSEKTIAVIAPTPSATAPLCGYEAIDAALNRNGRFLLALLTATNASPDRAISIWSSDAPGNQPVGSLSHLPPRVELKRVSLSDDARSAAIWEAKTACLYNVKTGQAIGAALPHPHTITNALFSPDGKHLLVFGGLKAHLFDAATGKLEHQLSHPKPLKYSQFSPNGRLLVTTCYDENFTHCFAQVWGVATGKPVGPPIMHGDGVLHASFSPDSAHLVSAGEDFTAIVSDLSGKRQPKFLKHSDQIAQAGFSPNGAWILTASRDKFARVWDAASGEAITALLPHSAGVSTGVFVNDTTFATIDKAGVSRLWQLQPASHSLSDLQLIAGLLGADPGLTASAIPPASAPLQWQSLRQRYPEQFSVSQAELLAWHQGQLTIAQQDQNSIGTKFHLKQIELLTATH